MLDLKRFEELKRSKTNTMLIVDGCNTLIRAISIAQSYKLQPFSLFFKMLGGLLDKFKPFQMYLVFDGEGGNNAKRLLFPQYKMNRNSVSKIQTKDYQILYQLLKHTPIIPLRLNNVQGDNVIGHIAKKNQSLGNNVIICSSDKDFYQLCSKQITVYQPIRKLIITQKDVIAKFNCHPINFSLYKSLVGDSSDNIPGIKGIGEKTIQKHFPNLFKQILPIQGSIQNFKKYIDAQMKYSDTKLKLLENFNMLKNFYKIVDLRSGCFLSPQIGIIIQKTINDKKQSLVFDKTNFLTQCKKYHIKNEDMVIIFNSLFLISKGSVK